jgi:8-oxo-dGTP diphosphatase
MMYNEYCPFVIEAKEKEMLTEYTADMIMLTEVDGSWYVLLIERGDDPFKGMLALPGGYLDEGENSEEAAKRETREEVTLTVEVPLTFVGRYGERGRDPRGHVVSDAYVVVLDDMLKPKAADDAKKAEWIPVSEALKHTLAFDHGKILRDALKKKRVKI